VKKEGLNEAKVDDLTKRMMKLTTRSNMTIAEVASAHFECLAGLAVEYHQGDMAKAAQLLRDSIEDLASRVESPSARVRVVVQNGKVVDAK
jgi:DNA polymerase II small subunit/DNA polymerase delta subunit B